METEKEQEDITENTKSKEKVKVKPKMVDIAIQTDNENDIKKQLFGDKIKLKNIKKIVLGGGFFKGYCLLGLYEFLLDNNIHKQINTIIGSSVGSIVGLCMNLDYNKEDIKSLITKLDFSNYENFTTENIINFTTNFGLDDGSKIVQLLKQLISYKTNNCYITFKQLYEFTNKTLIITGTNLETCNCEYFSHLTTPNMQVWLAVRISISVPIFYNKVEYNGKQYIDGAASSNCAIEFIEDYLKLPLNDVLCVSLPSEKNVESISHRQNTDSYSLPSYILDLISCFKFHDNFRMDKYYYNTLELKVDFPFYKSKITLEEKMFLFKKGYKITEEFFN